MPLRVVPEFIRNGSSDSGIRHHKEPFPLRYTFVSSAPELADYSCVLLEYHPLIHYHPLLEFRGKWVAVPLSAFLNRID